jgi:hypothetical protein
VRNKALKERDFKMMSYLGVNKSGTLWMWRCIGRRLLANSARSKGGGGGISDPFRSRSEQSDFKDFIQEKLNEQQKQSSEVDKPYIHESRNPLSSLIRVVFNPISLNERLRRKFNMNDQNRYKLIYVVNNERLLLVLYGMINMMLPLYLFMIVVLLIAELTDRSQLKRSFERPYETIGVLFIFMSFVLFLSKQAQWRNVLRIYYDNKEKNFILIDSRGIFNFSQETFKHTDVIYKFAQSKTKPLNMAGRNPLFTNLKRNLGNTYINGRARSIELERFSSNKYLDMIFGESVADFIRNEIAMQKQKLN